MGTLDTQEGHGAAYPRSNIFLEVESGKKVTNKEEHVVKVVLKVHHCFTESWSCCSEERLCL